MTAVYRLIVDATDDAPRRRMEEELEDFLRRRGERSLVTIEWIGQPNPAEIERCAEAAFFSDDIGGHVKGDRTTWESIPEGGRENYRGLVRAVLLAAVPPSAADPDSDQTRGGGS